MSIVGGQLSARVAELEEENAQLQHALDSRVLIEQAKGILAERYDLAIADAFELLRRAARSNRIRIHDLAAEVVASRATPQTVLDVHQTRTASGDGAAVSVT